MKIVIVGGESGGITLARYLKKRNKSLEICIVEKLTYISYSQCAMPYYLSGNIQEEDLLNMKEKDFEKEGIKLYLGSEVIEILKDEKAIKAIDIKTGNIFKLKYDALVLSVGMHATKLKEFDNVSPNIFIHRNILNAKRLRSYLDKEHPESCAIIGSGPIGLEVAESMNMRGIDVTLFEKEEYIFPLVSEVISKELENILKEYVTIITSAEITKTRKIEKKKKELIEIEYKLKDGSIKKKEFDFIIVAAGVRPATPFIKRAGITVDKDGYIIVDDKFMTNVNGIYAIGDIALVNSCYSGVKITPMNAPSSKHEAKILGNHLLGRDDKFKGSTNTHIASAFGFAIARTGLTAKRLNEEKIKYYTKNVMAKTSSPLFEGSEDILMSAFFEKETKRLLGASLIGKKDVDKKIDILSLAIKQGFNAKDLRDIEFAYMPRYSLPLDIINILGTMGEENEEDN